MFLKPKSLVSPFTSPAAACTFVLLLLSVRLALAHGDLDLQIATMGEEITKAPANAELYLRRAELHRLHGSWAMAQEDINKAVELAPDLPAANLILARLHFDTKRFAAAETALDKFLSRTPDHYDALVTRGRVRSAAGKHMEAAADFGKAIARTPAQDPEIYIEQARALAAAGSEHLPKSLAVLDRGMAQFGKLVTLGLYAVELECVRRNFDGALERLESLSANQPRKESWHERRGDVLDAAGRSDEARLAFEAGLEAIKTLPPHLQNTAAVQQRQERLEQKLKALAGSPR